MTLAEAYRALGVDPATAGRENVTKRYRELVKKLHPDVRPASERVRATSELQRLNEAFAAVRSSGFPALVPPPVRPAPGPASHPSPGNGYYAPPPPGNGFYAPPPSGNGYGAPPGSTYGNGSAPPYGNGYGPPYGDGYASPFGAGFGRPNGRGFAAPPPDAPYVWRPFGAAPRPTASSGTNGIVRTFRAVDGFMNVTAPFYFFGLVLAFFRTFGHWGGISAIVPLAVSMGLWNASKNARLRCWGGIQGLYTARGSLGDAAIGRDVTRNFTIAGATWAGAIGVLFFLLASR